MNNSIIVYKNSPVEAFAMNNCNMILAAAAKSAAEASAARVPVSGVADDVEGTRKFRCKTCGRGFDSFQALGGHRASHKKLRLENGGDDVGTMVQPKIHSCTICGAEFPIGQALGGHMRRHKPLATVKKGVILGSGNLSTVTTEVSLENSGGETSNGVKRKNDEVSDAAVKRWRLDLGSDLKLGLPEWYKKKEEIIENNKEDDEIEEGEIVEKEEEEDNEFLKLELRQPIRV